MKKVNRLLAILLLLLLCGILQASATATDTSTDLNGLLLGISGESEKTVVLYDPVTMEQFPISTMSGYALTNTDVSWSPDGQSFFILAYPEGEQSRRFLQVYDVNHEYLYDLSGNMDAVICSYPVAWSPDGRYLAYVESTTRQTVAFRLSMFDSQLGHSQPITTLYKREYFPNARAYNAHLYWLGDGNAVEMSVSTQDGTITQTWTPTGEQIPNIEHDPYVSRSNYQPFRFSISPDQHYSLIQRENETILLDLHQLRRFETTLPTDIVSVQWNIETGHLAFEWDENFMRKLGVLDLETEEIHILTPESTYLTGLLGGQWGVRENHVYAQITLPDDPRPHMAVWSLSENEWIYASDYVVPQVLFNWVDDRYIAYSAGVEGEEDIAGFYLLDTSTWQPTRLIAYPSEAFVYTTFTSSDSQHVALHILDYEGQFETIYVVEPDTLSTQQLPGMYPQRDPRERWIRWSPSGRYLAATHDYGQKTEILDTVTGQQLSYPLNLQWRIAYSPDEQYLVLESQDYEPDQRSAYLLELETGELHQFEHTRFVGWQYGDEDPLFICPEG